MIGLSGSLVERALSAILAFRVVVGVMHWQRQVISDIRGIRQVHPPVMWTC